MWETEKALRLNQWQRLKINLCIYQLLTINHVVIPGVAPVSYNVSVANRSCSFISTIVSALLLFSPFANGFTANGAN